MDTTSSQLPVCVYCGTRRPADESSCPTCGRAWIDVRVDDDAGGAVPAGAAAGAAAAMTATADDEAVGPIGDHAAAPDGEPNEDTNPTVPIVPPPPMSLDDTGEFSFDDWTMPPEKPRSRARWIIPIVLLIALVALWVFVFVDRGTSPTTTIAAATTTVPETTTTTVPESSTTVPETTTTSEVTTTTIAVPPPSVWPPVGDPIPTEDLVLRAAGVGPIEISDGIGEVAGRFTASLGEAEASGADGRCDGEAYWLQWGELRVTFDGFESGATFVSYYYEDVGSETSLELTTLSGLALGDTVADLTRIYASFTIAFEDIDGVEVFRLIDGGELLLWGPVTSSDPDGIVEGIYSPGPCSGA